MSAMNGFGYWSPADEDAHADAGVNLALGIALAALVVVGVPLALLGLI